MKRQNLNSPFILLIISLLMAFSAANAQNYSDENDNIKVPFKASQIIDGQFSGDTHWYAIRLYSGKYWTVKPNEVDCYSGISSFTDENYFCFVGDNVNGYKIYNKALGTNRILYCASSTSHEPLVPKLVSEAAEPNTFKVSRNEDGYNFYYPGDPAACINDLHGDNILTLWTNISAPDNTGCRMYFEEIKENAVKAPFETTTITNGKFADDTKWYTITIRDNKMLLANESILYCFTGSEVVVNNLWCFTGNANTGYSIHNYAFGAEYAVCAPSSDNKTKPYMERIAYAEPLSIRFSLSENWNGGYNIHAIDDEYACWNDFGKGGYIAYWNDSSAPNDGGSNVVFDEYNIKWLIPDDSDDEPEDDDIVTLLPVSGTVHYVYLANGGVDAYPDAYLQSFEERDSRLDILGKNGVRYTYDRNEYKQVTTNAPSADIFPEIESFKFNNKFNDMLMVDADGVIADDGKISVAVGGIGKRLVASIKTSADGARVYVADELQISKVTSRRFLKPTTYTVTLAGYNMLRQTAEGDYLVCPFGRDYIVEVDYLADHPTTEYGVPELRIKTLNGTMITSKTEYWDATISINGAGYYPDMADTPMQIKGRGNSSWSSDIFAKNPYRIKFAEKQKPLGMTAGKNWNLIANAQTGSMTTNVIGSRVAEMVDCAAANHFIPVELYINDEYRGSYTLTEKIGFSNNSIDLDDETYAVLLELDQYYDADFRFRSNPYYLPVNIKDPDLYNQNVAFSQDDVESDVNHMLNAVQSGEGAEKYIDMPALARFLMVNELIVNQELMHPKSMYLYNPNINAEDGLFVFGPAWDFDWAFGYEGSSTYFVRDAKADYWTMSWHERKQFIYDLRYNCGEELNKHYYRVWTDFVNNHLSDLLEYCKDYYNVASKSYNHDNKLWYSGDANTYSNITSRSVDWLKTRATYIYDYLSNTLGYDEKDYLEDEEVPEETGIVDIASVSVKASGIYDLSGRRLNLSRTSLPKGIYIIDGRKVIIK